MTIERIFHFAEASPDTIAIYRHGSELSYREFADAIGSARSEFIDRQMTGSGIVGVAIWDHQQFWICSLALRSLGLTTLAIRAPEDLPNLIVPGLKYVVGSASWPGLEQICQAQGLDLVPPPSLTAPPSKPAGPKILDGGGHILLSSGTTGRWKMVLWESAAFAASSKWWPKHGPQAVHHVFDYGPWTIAGFGIPQSTWTEGGGIIIHQDAEHHKALQNPRGTHAMLLPYYLGQVLSAPEGSFPFNETLTLYLSGGTVTASQIREAKRRVCPKVCNRLASTELGPVAITPIDDSQDHRWQAVLPGRGVEIVDEQDCAVPLGQIGQLRVSVGSGPAEYFNDPVATAKFFRHGYFYPGDLAMARSDGRIALQGRTTEIINVDGSKVAPGPIEDIVREKHSLSDVCLLSAQNSHGEEQVYAVVETAVPLSPQVLEQIANTFNDIRLTVLTVAKLPRTATGKIIRAEVQAGLFAAQNQSLLATEQPASRSAALAE